MATTTEPSLGPGVRLVVGEETLLSDSAAESAHDGVDHLRPQRPGRHIMVLHHGGPDSDPLVAMADRLVWIDGRVGAPRVIATGRSNDGAETAVIKLSAQAVSAASRMLPIEPDRLAKLMGDALREVHSLPVDDCTFDSAPEYWRKIAATRVASGAATTAADGPYSREDPHHLLEVLDELLEATRPSRGTPVLVHGHVTTAHTWLIPDGSVVLTGWQRAGLGDRHHDLAVAAASLSHNFGSAVVPVLLDAYGIDQVDLRTLDLHQLLVHLAGASA